MRKLNLNRILYVIMTFLLLIFVGYVSLSNIIPLKYILLIVLIMVLWDVALYFTLVTKGKGFKKRRIAGYIISIFLTVIISFITYYVFNTLNFFRNFTDTSYKEENYLILINNKSSFTSISDLSSIGYVNQELGNINKALDKLKEKKDLEVINYEQYNVLIKDLMDDKIDSVLIEESYYNILNESFNYSNHLKTLDRISIVTELDEITKEVDVTNTPFSIYISGIDTYGSIGSVSRSDVNMVVTVNPVTKQILLTSVPRDYYVQLRGTKGLKDKLTHAGVYGIDMSIGTLEDLLDVEINYYFRVNFSTLETVIDAIGGVDVYSNYTFVSSSFTGYTYQFKKGYNHLNGKQALVFSRERYNLPGGDRDRGKNQQAVISGVVNKVTSPSILTKYATLLNSLSSTFQTSMTEADIQKLIKMQLNDMAKWTITGNSLNGTDGYEYTYSTPNEKLYVMNPISSTVTKTIELIDKVYAGEKLESSYEDSNSNINNPTLVDIVTPPANDNTSSDEIENPDDTEEKPKDDDINNIIPGLPEDTKEDDSKEDSKTDTDSGKTDDKTNDKTNDKTEDKTEETDKPSNPDSEDKNETGADVIPGTPSDTDTETN